MCGILFARDPRKRLPVKPLLKRYKGQKSRGTRGFGYVTVRNDGTVSDVARATIETDILKAINAEDRDAGGSILFHHRWPTSIPNVIEGTHPIVISHESFKHDYIIVHNGVIGNAKTVAEDQRKEGFVFHTEMHTFTCEEFPNAKSNGRYVKDVKIEINDSETFAIDLCKVIEGKTSTFRVSGSIAFIALQVDKESGKVYKLFYGHNPGNPLVLEESKELFILKSLGHGKEVKEDVIFEVDYDTWETKERAIEIGFYTRKRAGFQYRGKDDERDTDFQNPRAYEGRNERSLVSGEQVSLLNVPPRVGGRYLPPEKSLREVEKAYEASASEQIVGIKGWHKCEISKKDVEIELSYARNNGDEETYSTLLLLKQDLEEVLSKENDALQELFAGQALLAGATDSKDLEEIADARSLLDVAEREVKEIYKERIEIEAELSAWI